MLFINFIKYFKNSFVGFIVSKKPRVSVFGHFSYTVTFPYANIIYEIKLKSQYQVDIINHLYI